MSSTKPRVAFFQRKRRKGQNHSLEQIFEALRDRLSHRFDSTLVLSPFVSSGVVKRLLNTLAAPFNQADINHVTGDINYDNLLLRKKKSVLTIHDCGVL
ncbi:MAG: hypothetical protein JJ975_14120, partial [Bacteroidia bacterium]|nr:hypothetical protein [Bacteroidia bacterium]